jgi:preprotein translocase subunit YajC
MVVLEWVVVLAVVLLVMVVVIVVIAQRPGQTQARSSEGSVLS